MMNPHFTVGFFSELTKEAYKVDERAMNERLRVGSGPMWSVAGGMTGLALGRKLTQTFGPKAFWPKALLMAIPAALAAKLFHNVATGGSNPEQEIAERALKGHVRNPTTG